MPNETRDYLDHLTKETADTITGTIKERLGDGTYLYEDVATGAHRYAKANLQDEFAVGSRVRIDRPSAGRVVVGSQDVIVNRAPREQRGLSATTPAVERDGFDRAVIVSVDPDPLVLTAGGEAGTQTIVGSGFTEAATYFARGTETPDPLVTDADAPEVANETVVMHISADGDSPLGDFDVEINGAVATKALRIIASTAPAAPLSLWYWLSDMSALVKVDASSGAVLATFTPVFNTMDGGVHPLLSDGTHVYAFMNARLLKVNIATGEQEEFDMTVNALGSGVIVDGSVYFLSGVFAEPLALTRSDLEGAIVETILLSATEHVWHSSHLRELDGVIYGSFRAADGGWQSVLASYDTITTDVVVTPNDALQAYGPIEVTEDWLGLHINTYVDPPSYRRYPLDLSAMDDDTTYPHDTGDGISARWGSKVYVAGRESSVPNLHVIDIDTLAVTFVSLAGLDDPAGIAATGSYVYVTNAGAANVMKIVNRSTLEVIDAGAPGAFGALLLA